MSSRPLVNTIIGTSVARNAVKNAFSSTCAYIGCEIERLPVAFVQFESGLVGALRFEVRV